MFDFIKKLFSTELPKEEVSLEQLSAWIDSKIEPLKENFNSLIKGKQAELEEIKNNVQELTKELVEAVPEDEEKIMPKVRSVVEGHRQNYVKGISRLIEEVPELEQGSAAEFCKEAKEKLDEFGKSTAKSYYATQHLFHKPVEGMAREIKRIDDMIKEITKSIEDSKSEKAEELKKSTQDILKSISLLNESKEQLKTLKAKIEDLENSIKERDTLMNDLKASEEYKEYEKNIDKLRDLKESFKNNTNAIYESLAPLDTALKKYERVAMDHVETIKSYLKGPVDALIADTNLDIIELLKKLYKSVIEDSIDLKDKKKVKTVKTIQALTRAKLEDFQTKYKELGEQVNTLKKNVQNSPVKFKEDELLKSKNDKELLLKKTIAEMEDTNKRMSKIDIEKSKETLKESLKETFQIEVSI